jgi:dTDP-4-amino-4,6-dideoxygalactose transaminase
MILMNDFKSEPPELREAMLVAVRRVLESGWYVLGTEVVEFEKQWAITCGAAYGVGVGNGMDAIEIALRALDIGPGDEVITTPMTAFATVLAIFRAGATPVLADIDFRTGLLSIESAKRCLTGRTRALVLVHLYGQIRAMDEWQCFCREHGLAFIEDCAQAHLAAWQGKGAGSFGHAGAYSFYPTKNLGAAGDGGMLVSNDATVAKRAGQLRNYGQESRYHHPVLGMNSRLDEVHAAMLKERLLYLPEFTQRRREIAHAYNTEIRNPHICLPAPPEEPDAHVYHLYAVTCKCRNELQKHLEANQVQSLIHYPIPIHHQEPCRTVARDPAGLPSSEQHAERCLSLPCHPQMTDADIQSVIRAANAFR